MIKILIMVIILTIAMKTFNESNIVKMKNKIKAMNQNGVVKMKSKIKSMNQIGVMKVKNKTKTINVMRSTIYLNRYLYVAEKKIKDKII